MRKPVAAHVVGCPINSRACGRHAPTRLVCLALALALVALAARIAAVW
jgi:hypothetical protein